MIPTYSQLCHFGSCLGYDSDDDGNFIREIFRFHDQLYRVEIDGRYEVYPMRTHEPPIIPVQVSETLVMCGCDDCNEIRQLWTVANKSPMSAELNPQDGEDDEG